MIRVLGFERHLLAGRLPERYWRGYWFATRFAAIGVAVLAFHYLHPVLADAFGVLPGSNAIQLQATALFATTLLLFALVAAYRDLAATQRDLLDTQRRQAAQLTQDRCPHVELVGTDFPPGADTPDRVWLSNHGRGPALDLDIVSHIEYPHRGTRHEGTGRAGITRFDDRDLVRRDRSIPPGTTEVGFRVRTRFDLGTDADERELPLAHAMWTLRERGVERFDFQFHVGYTDLLGEPHLRPLVRPRRLDFRRVPDGEQVRDIHGLLRYSDPIEDGFDEGFTDLSAAAGTDDAAPTVAVRGN